MIRSYHGLLCHQDVIAHKNFLPVITLCDHSLFTPTFLLDGIWDFRGRGEQEIHALVEFYVEKTNLERNLKNRNANMKRKTFFALMSRKTDIC